jgi:hypothetical protein
MFYDLSFMIYLWNNCYFYLYRHFQDVSTVNKIIKCLNDELIIDYISKYVKTNNAVYE